MGRWLIRPYVAGVEVTQAIQYFGAEDLENLAARAAHRGR
jgi:hypothetical protein